MKGPEIHVNCYVTEVKHPDNELYKGKIIYDAIEI